MPIIKSAIKKARQDRRKTVFNLGIKGNYKKAISAFRKKTTQENLQKAYSAIDKAMKRHIIHKNKAARLKSALSAKLSLKNKSKPAARTPKNKPSPEAKKSHKK